MEESKELQGFYKIFRAVIYVSILMEFFAYALEPEQLDFLGGVVTDIHTRIKRWMIYHDGNLVYSVIVKTCSDSLFSIGQKNCQLFVAKLRNFLDSHNRMVLY